MFCGADCSRCHTVIDVPRPSPLEARGTHKRSMQPSSKNKQKLLVFGEFKQVI